MSSLTQTYTVLYEEPGFDPIFQELEVVDTAELFDRVLQEWGFPRPQRGESVTIRRTK